MEVIFYTKENGNSPVKDFFEKFRSKAEKQNNCKANDFARKGLFAL